MKGVLEADGGAVGRRSFPGIGFTRSAERPWAATARKVAAPTFALTQTRGADGTVTLHAAGPADGEIRSAGKAGDHAEQAVRAAAAPAKQ